MKIHFEHNLKFQQDAISSVVELFNGAFFVRAENNILAEVSANIININPEDIFNNFDRITHQNSIEETHKQKNELDFSIEMETGTGKTYVYLRTILELHKTYGLNKFIIVVPSVAVKEGTIKTLKMTEEHFRKLYSVNVEYFEYNSKKATRVRHFALSNSLQIMVTNTQAFNTDDRIINQERDANNGVKLIDLIKQTRPIIIMDEPQEGMDSDNMRKRFAGLTPLFKLRYSATHKKMVNLVYKLTPYDAYNKGLVKKIEVYSIHETNTQSNVQIEFEDIKLQTGGKIPKAKLRVSFRLAGGGYKTKSATFNKGDNLEKRTGNPVYKGWVISRIFKSLLDDKSRVEFSNGTKLVNGSKFGWDKEAIFREQIKWTIRKHFDKKDRYQKLGIKVLSLFFIDKVANYMENDGIIRKLFVDLYQEWYKKKYGVEPEDIDKVHNGYFSKTKKGEYTDNISSMSKNKEIYNIIMRDKERLLSFEEPLEFIFSHSALGVGWDNPNIFNICTLNESESVIKKRQEIGRGLRISVTQDGKRYRDASTITVGTEINLLTVIANQSYYAFAKSYQNELLEEYGTSHKIALPRNAKKKPREIKLNEKLLKSNDFRLLWEKISKKTEYSVTFRESAIIDKCIEALDEIVVHRQEIKIEATRIDALSVDTTVEQNSSHIGSAEAVSNLAYASMNMLLTIMEQTKLSRPTVLEIMGSLKNKAMVYSNPAMYLPEAVKQIKNILSNEMVRVVRYNSIKDSFDISLFKKIIETYGEIVPVKKGLYDSVIYDSNVEKDFTLDIENENKIRCFLKLPSWYKIDTPIGKYNPDFALVIEKKSLDSSDSTKYYFVVETKGADSLSQLRSSEEIKIECATKHFEAVGLAKYLAPVKDMFDFKTKAKELVPNIF